MGQIREKGLRRVALALVEVEIETRTKHDLASAIQSVMDESPDDVRTLLM